MKKIVGSILLVFTLQLHTPIFADKEYDKYFIYFKDAISNFHLKNHSSAEGINASKKKIKQKKVGKAILVNWSFILADSISYWSKYTKWLEDWQFTLTWKDQKRRFFTTEAIKFDSNPFMTNWTHGISGAGFFNIARYYRLNIFESVLFSLSSSLSWEYLTEWREVISINDIFFSGIAGLHIGEPIFQTAKYLLSGKGLSNKIFGYLLNPVFAINDLIGSKKWRENFKEEYYGTPNNYFNIGYKSNSFSNSETDNLRMTNIRMETIFINIPNFNKNSTEKFSGRLKNTFFSRISFDISFTSRHIEEYSFETEAVISGFAKKQFIRNPNNRLKGFKYYFGLSTAFELYKKRSIVEYDKGEFHYDFTKKESPPQPTQFTDKLAIIDLLGPAFNFSQYYGNFRINLLLNAYFNFSLVNSLALNEYSKYNDLSEPYKKTTLTHYGYYYAFGYSLRGGLALSFGNLKLSGLIKHQKFASIQSLDRFQNEIEDDAKVKDERTINRVELEFRIPKSKIFLVATVENIFRKGEFKEIIEKKNEHRIYTKIKFSF